MLNDPPSHTRLRNLERRVFVGLALGTTVLFFWMVRAFLLPVFWAAILAILFRPLFLRISDQLRGRRSLAALVTVIIVILIVLVPFGLILAAVAQQALALYGRIAVGDIDVQRPIELIELTLPRVTDLLARYGIQVDWARTSLQNAAVSTTQYIAGHALAIGQNALIATILSLLMLYLLFFFLRDGERIMAGVARAIPMGEARERRFFGQMAMVSRATVRGTLVIAVVQGTLGGGAFAIVGIEAAVLWGVIMGILSLLPAVGPALVWGPAAIIFLATGAYWKGILLIVLGTLVISLVDNFLRPIIIGRETRMPDYLVLLATLGGLTVFGLAGLVAGPMIAALFLVTWQIFAEEYSDDGPAGTMETAEAKEIPAMVPEQGSGTPDEGGVT